MNSGQLNPMRCENGDLIKLVNSVAIKNGWGNILNEQILKELERNGLPINKVGSKKYYNIFELAVFLLVQYTEPIDDTLERKVEVYKTRVIEEVMR